MAGKAHSTVPHNQQPKTAFYALHAQSIGHTQPLHRVFSGLFFLLLLLFCVVQPVEAAKPATPHHSGATKASVKEKAAGAVALEVVGGKEDSEEVKTILQMVQQLLAASNRHDLAGLLNFYSPKFVSGDNLSLSDVRQLVEETWKVYPDIRYDSQTVAIRLNGNWATVESLDTAEASAKADPTVSAENGKLLSRSRALLFLHRIGKTWEIVSDYTLYERASILYGDAASVGVSLSTPDQVFAGEPYTARVDAELPNGAFAIATIAKNEVIYPQPKPEEKFRTLSGAKARLERVFEANSVNRNEIITATVGLTSIGQDAEERPTIQLNGIATLVKRVNVLPKTATTLNGAEGNLVRTSADGKIDLRKVPVKPEEAETDATRSSLPPEQDGPRVH
ncbi:MAG: nuclear transport factor 2 family protein [Candidatus Melainabacteria bacterium]|nr:nuclear transport factor 2 family protein [Candidatus Melainabacteria bacterium]